MERSPRVSLAQDSWELILLSNDRLNVRQSQGKRLLSQLTKLPRASSRCSETSLGVAGSRRSKPGLGRDEEEDYERVV